jgi:hypothetical protein
MAHAVSASPSRRRDCQQVSDVSASPSRRRDGEAVSDDVRDLLRAVIAEQAAQRVVLAAILVAVERNRGPRDGADTELLLSIREAVGDQPFTARKLVEYYAPMHQRLTDALEAVNCVSAHDVGVELRSLVGGVTGLRVERDDDTRDGMRWRVKL